jgi:hypothetical protein
VVQVVGFEDDDAERRLVGCLPHHFSLGRFKLGSTVSGLPTDADLVRTITNGMPGSGMPPATHLTRDEIAAVARVVRRLASFYCSECHCDDGTARDVVDDELKHSAGRPTRARDLTYEPLKGGATPEELIRRSARRRPCAPLPGDAYCVRLGRHRRRGGVAGGSAGARWKRRDTS